MEDFPITGNTVHAYQLIRGVLAAFAWEYDYLLLCDGHSEDLIERWFQVMRVARRYTEQPQSSELAGTRGNASINCEMLSRREIRSLLAWFKVAPPEVNIFTLITAMQRPHMLRPAGLLDPVVHWLRSRYIAFRPPCMLPASHSRRREDQLPKEVFRLHYRKP